MTTVRDPDLVDRQMGRPRTGSASKLTPFGFGSSPFRPPSSSRPPTRSPMVLDVAAPYAEAPYTTVETIARLRTETNKA